MKEFNLENIAKTRGIILLYTVQPVHSDRLKDKST